MNCAKPLPEVERLFWLPKQIDNINNVVFVSSEAVPCRSRHNLAYEVTCDASLCHVQLLGAVRRRHSGQLPHPPMPPTPLPTRGPARLPNAPQPSRAASGGQSRPGESAEQVPSARMESLDGPAGQLATDDGQSSRRGEGNTAAEPAPDPPTVLELVVGDKVRRHPVLQLTACMHTASSVPLRALWYMYLLRMPTLPTAMLRAGQAISKLEVAGGVVGLSCQSRRFCAGGGGRHAAAAQERHPAHTDVRHRRASHHPRGGPWSRCEAAATVQA